MSMAQRLDSFLEGYQAWMKKVEPTFQLNETGEVPFYIQHLGNSCYERVFKNDPNLPLAESYVRGWNTAQQEYPS